MGELGVVVVAEDVVEAAGGRGERVDVRVRVEQGDAAEFVVEGADERVMEHGTLPASGVASAPRGLASVLQPPATITKLRRCLGSLLRSLGRKIATAEVSTH